jgi:hypothetical protein
MLNCIWFCHLTRTKHLAKKINVEEEGNKYYFGNIKFLWNTVYQTYLAEFWCEKGNIQRRTFRKKESQIKLNPDEKTLPIYTKIVVIYSLYQCCRG